MYQNQLSKRNLPADAISYYCGKLYEQRKQAHGGTGANRFTKVQTGNCCQSVKGMSSEIATKQKVSERTVRNDAAFAKAVEG